MSRRIRRAILLARASHSMFMDEGVITCTRRAVRRYVAKPRRVPWEARFCLAIGLLLCQPAVDEQDDREHETHTHTDFFEVPNFREREGEA